MLESLAPALELFAAQQRSALQPMLEAIAAQQREALGPALGAIATQQRNVLERFALSAQLLDQLDLVAFSSVADTLSAQAKALLDSFQLPEGLIEGFRRLGWELPSSWPRDRIEDVYEMVRTTGVPIGSVAPTQVVEACLEAFENGRDPHTVIHDHHDELVEVLLEQAARTANLDNPSDAQVEFIELVELLANRHHRAVVVTAFSIVDELLYRVTYQSYGAIGADRLDRDFDEQPLAGFRQQVAVHCLAPCYAHFDKTSGERPSALNRHAAVHTASPTQATPEYALVAALLVANLLDAAFSEPVD